MDAPYLSKEEVKFTVKGTRYRALLDHLTDQGPDFPERWQVNAYRPGDTMPAKFLVAPTRAEALANVKDFLAQEAA
jgi:hypothetical protein